MREKCWKIYWRDFSNQTYMYGSRVIFHSKRDVEFNNLLIPPGTVIKTWKSMANYQLMRVEPTLPIIDGERSYRVRLYIDEDAEDGVLLRFRFFQKNGVEEGIYILRGLEGEFRCPIRTYYYDIELIESGAHSFHFHYITLEEIDEGAEGLRDEKKKIVSKRNKKNP